LGPEDHEDGDDEPEGGAEPVAGADPIPEEPADMDGGWFSTPSFRCCSTPITRTKRARRGGCNGDDDEPSFCDIMMWMNEQQASDNRNREEERKEAREERRERMEEQREERRQDRAMQLQMMQSQQQMQTQMMTAMMMMVGRGDRGVCADMMPLPFAAGESVVTGEATVLTGTNDEHSE